MLSKRGKATTMNEFENVLCFNGKPLFLLLLQITVAALSKNKREMKSEKLLSKMTMQQNDGKATTMNEINNIPCLN